MGGRNSQTTARPGTPAPEMWCYHNQCCRSCKELTRVQEAPKFSFHIYGGGFEKAAQEDAIGNEPMESKNRSQGDEDGIRKLVMLTECTLGQDREYDPRTGRLYLTAN